MARENWRYVLNIIYLVVTIVTVIYAIWSLMDLIQHPSQDDILEFGTTGDFILRCFFLSPFFIAEYGVYSALKYYIFAEKKKIIKLIYETIKMFVSVIVFVCLLRFTILV